MTSIILGGGCFWCTQSVFSSLEGIDSVVFVHAGGTTADYEMICMGNTDHILKSLM